MDPASVALSRRREGDWERLIMDLHVYPFPLQEFGLLQFLRPKTNSTMLSRPADVIMLAEARIIGFEPLFTGLLDRTIPFEVKGSEVITVDAYSEEAGLFFGGWNLDNVSRWLGTDAENIPADDPGELEGNWFYGGNDTWGQIAGDHVVIAGNADDVSAVVNRFERVDADSGAIPNTFWKPLRCQRGCLRPCSGMESCEPNVSRQFNIPEPPRQPVSYSADVGRQCCR